jgi:predicted acyl esterase
VRISGTPTVLLNMAFSASRANLTAALVSYPPTGNGTILTRGWLDPANRDNDRSDIPVRPGTFYRLAFDMQPKDSVVPAGNRIALMVISSDRDFTIRPAPGTQLTLDPARSSLALPVVGGAPALGG